MRDTDAVDLDHVAAYVTNECGAAPSAVVGAAVRCSNGWRLGWGVSGFLWYGDAAPSVTVDAVFDLASVSKPFTALTLARLERAGVVARSDTLGAVLPELADTVSGGVALDLLSAHRAGLEAHREMFVKRAGAVPRDRASILREAAEARRPECQGAVPEDGFSPQYSDLGYMLLGAALVRAAGEPLDALANQQLSVPLGLTVGSMACLRTLDDRIDNRVVPTEVVPWRGGMLRGVVHDENAWVLQGDGFAGHAGLFGDASSVVRLGVALVEVWHDERPDLLSAAELAPLVRRRPGGTLCAGFDRRSEDGDGRNERGVPMSGRHFGPETFGHLGFTGTSLWIDPQLGLVAVLLTNRVHPSREHIAIRKARPAAHDAIFDAMTSAGGSRKMTDQF